MRMYDIIYKKRTGGVLSKDETDFFVRGVTDGSIPDYQTAALLMAIFLVGMDSEETASLTLAMAHSGDLVDLSAIPGVKVDKHSTGGVGDKTTLITAPIAAACGVPVAKMSGRGLGFTGGTIDKLEAIPGFCTALSMDDFTGQVQRIGLALAGQTGNLAPADKKLYALRDLTTTVDSIPLIAASVMSKKIAAGADRIVLDVKLGSGAFMKTSQEAETLAREMVSIGRLAGRRVTVLITDMDAPLGRAVGNTLEVVEAIEVLGGRGPQDITELSVLLAAHMVSLATDLPIDACRAQCEAVIKSGAALEKLADMVEAQRGDARYIHEPQRFSKAAVIEPFRAARDGYITHMDAEAVGHVSMMLGAGRAAADDAIDPAAGLVFTRKPGDRVEAGETLCYLHTSDAGRVAGVTDRLRDAVVITDMPEAPRPLVYAEISGQG